MLSLDNWNMILISKIVSAQKIVLFSETKLDSLESEV